MRTAIENIILNNKQKCFTVKTGHMLRMKFKKNYILKNFSDNYSRVQPFPHHHASFNPSKPVSRCHPRTTPNETTTVCAREFKCNGQGTACCHCWEVVLGFTVHRNQTHNIKVGQPTSNRRFGVRSARAHIFMFILFISIFFFFFQM